MDEPIRSFRFKGSPFVAGWGKLEEGGKTSSVLMQIQVPIIDYKVCRKIYEKIERTVINEDRFGEMDMCAGMKEGLGTCEGDSGGALMMPIEIERNGTFHFYQIGLVAYAAGCGRKIPTVYTRIQYYIDWIQTRIQE